MKILSRKRSILLIVLITFILSQVYSRYMVLRSEPYLFSIQFLMNNSKVIENLGRPQKIALATFNSYGVHNNPNSVGTAKFTLVVHGSNGDSKAFLELDRDTSNWRIKKAGLLLKNGQQLDLLSDK